MCLSTIGTIILMPFGIGYQFIMSDHVLLVSHIEN